MRCLFTCCTAIESNHTNSFDRDQSARIGSPRTPRAPRAPPPRYTMVTMAKISLLGPVHRMASILLSAIWRKIWPVPSQGGIRAWIQFFLQTTMRDRSGTSNAAPALLVSFLKTMMDWPMMPTLSAFVETRVDKTPREWSPLHRSPIR